ncbi:MAG: thiamine pyrophosphate-dependent enzyme [Candidatus Odinarchaeia archaeon]
MADFATAVKYNLPIKVVLYHNNELSMIRHEQIESKLPPYEIELVNPDYIKFAETLGGTGVRITKEEELDSKIKAALEFDKPTIIEVHTDPLSYWANDGAFKD